MLLVGMVLLGGIKRIGSVSEKLVPFMALLYIVLAIGVVVLNFERVPAVFHDIVYGAFNPAAVTGGVIGSFFLSLKKVYPAVSFPMKQVLVPVLSPMPVLIPANR